MVSDTSGLYGFIDTTGTFVIPIKYLSASSCSNGLIAACISAGQCGYLDAYGKERIPFNFSTTWPYKNGGAVARKAKYGFIDPMGRNILDFKYDRIGGLSEGLIRARKNGKWAYYGKSGERMLSGDWTRASDFHHGVAAVGDSLLHLIDISGHRIGSNAFERLTYANENRWMGESKRQFYILNERGVSITSEPFSGAYSFSEGKAAVKSDEEYWVYIDTSGQIDCRIGVPLPWSFKEGLCRIISRGGFGFVDHSCNPVISPQFLDAGDFYDNRAKVKINRYTRSRVVREN